ncbi:hypothetical protein [Brachyspira sp. SAP_772]|uniref:hypothetical protein n=1 Tax=Brachyspira sp. SAP_772 TaxID=2608385 RepID=UPI0012F48CD7|nr:hypothetical protein [Brachyspira sp. SAP_772]
MNIKVILLFISINIFLFAQSTSNIGDNNILINTGIGRVDYTTYTIYADATADILTDKVLHPEALLILQEQAEEETFRTLYQTLGNIIVNGDYTVYNIIEENDKLREDVMDFVNNARLLGVSYPSRTSVKVLMALDIITNQLMSNFIQNMNTYKTTPIVTYIDAGTDYDGLVIDARGIGFKPSLFPTIYNENGDAIYDIAYINKQIASTNGYIKYSTNSFLTNQIYTNFTGRKPYNIVAWSTRGRFASDLVIGNEDASIILSAPKLKEAIRNCKVTVIID